MLFSCERSSAKTFCRGFSQIFTDQSGAEKKPARVLSKIDVRGPASHGRLGPSGAEDRAHVSEAGDFTAGEIPVPIPNTEVKPRRADCTARESVWESRSLPALIKATFRNECGLFLFTLKRLCGARALARRCWKRYSCFAEKRGGSLLSRARAPALQEIS